MAESRRYYLVRIESYEGEDTFVCCGDERQDYLYCVIVTGPKGIALIVDSGYRSEAEARDAWPEVSLG